VVIRLWVSAAPVEGVARLPPRARQWRDVLTASSCSIPSPAWTSLRPTPEESPTPQCRGNHLRYYT